MSGRDALVIMVAGGGKSLCYQLPVLCVMELRSYLQSFAFLLSLIRDQVMGLAASGIPAYILTSTTSEEGGKFIYKALRKGEGELKILYVTPETISESKGFMSTWKMLLCFRSMTHNVVEPAGDMIFVQSTRILVVAFMLSFYRLLVHNYYALLFKKTLLLQLMMFLTRYFMIAAAL